MKHSIHQFVFAAALLGAALSTGCSSTDTPAQTNTGADTSPSSDSATADSKPSEGGAGDAAGDPLDVCLSACETTHQGGVAKYQPIDTCAGASCASECGGTGGGTDGGTGSCPAVGPSATQFTFGEAGCDACLAANCCMQVTDCMNDTACLALNQCIDKCYVDNP